MSISPSAGGSFGQSDPTWRPDAGGGGRPRWFTLFILVAFAVLFGVAIYQVMELRGMRIAVDQANAKLQTHDEQITKLEGNVVRGYKQAEENISALRGEVSTTRGQINAATKQVTQQVLSKTEQMAQQLSAEQKAETAKLGGAVEELKTASSATEGKLGALSGDVSNVKSDVTSTKAQLDKTIAELKSVRGDLGVESGKIATNGQELAALKRLGERNYFEFNLAKTKEPQKVGNISVKLKAADPKRNKYTLDVLADDKLTEKKDKSINEPVQFYVAKAKIPYEIVVNQVQKNRVVGYLATPKDQGR